MAEFDIKVEYIPGKVNKVVDCLSRLRHQEDSLKDENIFLVKEVKEDMYLEWDLEKLLKLQDEDNYYGLLKKLLKKGYDVDKMKKEISKHKTEKIFYIKVLHKMAQNIYGEVSRQIIIPNSYKHQVLYLLCLTHVIGAYKLP